MEPIAWKQSGVVAIDFNDQNVYGLENWRSVYKRSLWNCESQKQSSSEAFSTGRRVSFGDGNVVVVPVLSRHFSYEERTEGHDVGLFRVARRGPLELCGVARLGHCTKPTRALRTQA